MAVTASGQQQQPLPTLVVQTEPPANSSLGLLGNRSQQMMIVWWRGGLVESLITNKVTSVALYPLYFLPFLTTTQLRFPVPSWSPTPPHGGNITPAAEASGRKKLSLSLPRIMETLASSPGVPLCCVLPDSD